LSPSDLAPQPPSSLAPYCIEFLNRSVANYLFVYRCWREAPWDRQGASLELLFPFAESWWLYAGFTAVVLGLLAVDLGVFHRRAHVVSFREAAGWSVVWVSLSLAVCIGLGLYAGSRFGYDTGRQMALEFLAGYIVEKSLAVDNIFVFVLVFRYFAVPLAYQHRVLFYGILGALAFRAVFIAIGAALLRFELVMTLFGVFLLVTGARMLWSPEPRVEPDRNVLVRLLRRVLPITPTFEGSRFLVRHEGRLQATPLLVALVFLEVSDVVFAVDSVPAIFALTSEPLIVFTSNVCAILGLRAMYVLLAGAIERFHLIGYGLACVLMFVGLKMVWLNAAFDGHFPITWSLAIITLFIGGSVAASLAFPRRIEAPEVRRKAG
jgi:tellurite resistance protein TerC